MRSHITRKFLPPPNLELVMCSRFFYLPPTFPLCPALFTPPLRPLFLLIRTLIASQFPTLSSQFHVGSPCVQLSSMMQHLGVVSIAWGAWKSIQLEVKPIDCTATNSTWKHLWQQLIYHSGMTMGLVNSKNCSQCTKLIRKWKKRVCYSRYIESKV